MCISDEVTCESSLSLATFLLYITAHSQMLLLCICRFKQDSAVLEAITGVSKLKMLFQTSVCYLAIIEFGFRRILQIYHGGCYPPRQVFSVNGFNNLQRAALLTPF